MILKFKCYNIDWDTDGISPKKLKLPTGKKIVEVEVPHDIIEQGYDEVEEYISDCLSDEYGFCHNGFECPQLDELWEKLNKKA